MEPQPLSSGACEYAWRLLAMWFCDHGFVCSANAALCSFCVPPVIAGSAIAVSPAASKRGSVRDAAPTVGTSRVPKGGSIIATASGDTAGDRCKRA